MAAFDVLIRHGRVVDGTGSPWFPADVGIVGERIEAVGNLDGASARREIDARDLTVAPGFIDIHDHSDFTLIADPRAVSAIHQGVTTLVPGNCGFSAAPVTDAAAQKRAMYGYVEGLDVSWHSFRDYLEVLRVRRPAVNVAPLIGHGAIRSATTGFTVRPPSPEETRTMARTLQAALEAGAFGLSIGLEYAPGQNATPEELTALARVAAATGRLFTAHIRSRDFGYQRAADEVLAIASAAGVSTQLSHLTARFGALRHADEAVRERVEAARDRGLDVTCDQHPFPFSNASATTVLPPWAFEGGRNALHDLLADGQTRERCKTHRSPQNKLIVAGEWHLISIIAAPHSPELLGRPLDEVADERGCDPYDVIFDAMLAEGDDVTSVRLHAQHYVDEAVLRDALCHPLFMLESDGQTLAPDGPLAEQRNPYSYGWVARCLGSYVRDRGWLRLEEAIRKLTSFPARKLGLVDRGQVRPGALADVVVFNAARVRQNDTPLEPSRFPDGFHYVLVNGALTLANGQHTGAAAGKVLQPQ